MIKVKIAGHVFGLENRFREVETTCRKYFCDQEPEAVFSVTPQRIDEMQLDRGAAENESSALHGCIVHHLMPQDFLLFHGSCLALDGQAILFTAPSGTGKSTHSRLWRERFGNRVVMVNDDKPLLQLTPDGWLAHGTPWSGKHGRNSRPGDPDFDTPAAFPLHCIVVIKRGEKNSIRRLAPQEIPGEFFHQTYFPSMEIADGQNVDPFALRVKAIELMDKLGHLPVYELRCTISQEAVDLTLAALRENCAALQAE